MEDVAARYSGRLPVTPAGPLILSRHTLHPGNALAMEALEDELSAVGNGRLVIRRHTFEQDLYNLEAVLPGSGLQGIVILAAHVDSTAKNTPGYNPVCDAAPGADDNASGIAAVLNGARAMVALAQSRPESRREIRFLFFNAEEQELKGSRAYVREQVALDAPIVAAFHVDMIGHTTAGGQTFELHAGHSRSQDVQDRSVELARLVVESMAQVSGGRPQAQIYPGVERFDPGQRRSDHYSFHLAGYAACLATQDLYAGPGPTAPKPDPNPHYHTAGDTSIDAAYAAAIARGVARAAWVAASR